MSPPPGGRNDVHLIVVRAVVIEVVMGPGGVHTPLIVGKVHADPCILPQFAGVCSKLCCCMCDVCDEFGVVVVLVVRKSRQFAIGQ